MRPGRCFRREDEKIQAEALLSNETVHANTVIADTLDSAAIYQNQQNCSPTQK